MIKTKVKQLIFLFFVPVISFLLIGIFSCSMILKVAAADDKIGGGFFVGSNTTLNFNATISGSSATNGGGVYVSAGGTFNMNGGAIYGNTATANGNNIYNAGTFTMNGGRVGTSGSSSSGYGVYNTGTMNLYGGNVYDNVYSSASFNTKMACNIAGAITLGDSATISVQDYAGVTPEYNIELLASRGVGTIMTFIGSATEPDLTKLSISGYDSATCELSAVKDASGNWTVSLVPAAFEFPADWKTQVASSTYMTTTVTPKNITKIQFVATVPSGYTKIGTLSTGLPVYQGTTATEIAFVGGKIIAPNNCRYLLSFLSNLASIHLNTFNTNKVVDMSYMFSSNKMLATIEFGDFDTSDVANMENMFDGCSKLTSLDVSKFDTSKVINMRNMFYDCNVLEALDVSKFNTSNVTNMNYMFDDCKKLTFLDVGNFNTSNVIDMCRMFSGCSAIKDLNVESFNTSNVTNMSGMFSLCKGLTNLDVGNFNTSKVTSMGSMFSYCEGLTSLDVSNFDTSKVTDMGSMFNSCKSLTSLNASNFDTSKVTNMSHMFSRCTNVTSLNVSSFNTSNVTNMIEMFFCCSKLTSLDISNFNTTNVTDMRRMFDSCRSLTSLDVSNFNTTNVTYMDYMFYDCQLVTGLEVGGFDTSKVTDMSNMFGRCYKLTSLDVSNFNTSKVTKMEAMFGGTNITSLNLSTFDTSKVTDMSNLFSGCSKLSSLNISGFNTSNVKCMDNMFIYCSSLSSIDLSSFDTSNVTGMYYMFAYSGFVGLDLSNFNMSKVTSVTGMLNFGSTTKLRYLKTPYNNTSAISITTGNSLYDVSTGAAVTNVPANTTVSKTYATKFTLNLDANGGSCDVSSLTGYYGCTLSQIGVDLPIPTKTGFVFSDWLQPNGTKVVESTKLTFTEDTTLTASWEEVRWKNDYEFVEYIMFTRNHRPSGYSEQFTSIPDIDGEFYCDSSRSKVVICNSSTITAPEDCSYLFSGLRNLKGVQFKNFDTFNTVNFEGMFMNCEDLEYVDLISFQTPAVRNMISMFENCKNLRYIFNADFDCISLEVASRMFYGCKNLTTQSAETNAYGTIPSFPNLKYTYNLVNASEMFAECGLDYFVMPYMFTDNLEDVSGMFKNSNFIVLDLSQFDFSKVVDYSGFTSGLNVSCLYTPRYCDLSMIHVDDLLNYYQKTVADIATLLNGTKITFSICFVDNPTEYGTASYTLSNDDGGNFDNIFDSSLSLDTFEDYCFGAISGGLNIGIYYYSDIYYLLPTPYEYERDSETNEKKMAGWSAAWGNNTKDEIIFNDGTFVDFWNFESVDGSTLVAVSWGEDGVFSLDTLLSSVSGDVYIGITPYKNVAENRRAQLAHIRYLPSFHEAGYKFTGWRVDLGTDSIYLDYYTNIGMGGRIPLEELSPNFRQIELDDGDQNLPFPYSLPTTTSAFKGSAAIVKEENGEERKSNSKEFSIDFEYQQECILPNDKKVIKTQIKKDKAA